MLLAVIVLVMLLYCAGSASSFDVIGVETEVLGADISEL